MIDDLAMRASLTGAAFLLLATGLSVNGLLGADRVREAALGLATHIARAIDDVASLRGAVIVRAGIGASIPLPPTVAGSSYTILLRANSVVVSATSATSAVGLRTPVHPFPPIQGAFTAKEIRELDQGIVETGPGRGFIVENRSVLVDGEPNLLTFLTLPP